MHIHASDLTALLELDLTANGWNGSLEPYPGMPVDQFAMTHLRKSLTKKYLPGTTVSNFQGDVAALDLFLSINKSCSTWHLDWPSVTSWEEVAINEAKAFIERFFYPEGTESILSLSKIYSGLGIGPGSSIGAMETDFYSKLATSKLSTTDRGLYVLYRDAISFDPIWNGMEQLRSEKMGNEVVTGSRLSFVPKTAKISRTICTEPILNMMFQKGIANVLEHRLADMVGIYLSSQPDKNVALAQVGSRSGKFATIDLSSASDSMSLTLCKEILPRQVFDLLMRARSPSATLPSGEVIDLHMIASMGNAFCFPLQTLLFVAVVVGCYRACGLKLARSSRKTLGNFAVFGDDIIVLSEAYPLVTRVLSLLGFSVNHDKSFNEGDFRESCGSDYYQGHNVRGVYIKTLRDANDCYSAINRLVRYCARHEISLFNLVRYLTSKCRFMPVPYDESDDAGIKVPEFMLANRSLHPHTRATFYRYSHLVERKVRMEVDKGLPRLSGWFENPDGLLLAFLAGSIRTGFVVLRTNGRKAVIRKRYSSRWDYIPSDQVETPGYAHRWKWCALGHFDYVPQ